MVNENMDINELVKTCKILLLDIEGTTTSISFVKDKLFPYVEEHVQGYLESKWEDEHVKEAIAALRKLESEDKENKLEGLVEIPGEDKSKEDQIEGLVKNVKWQMSSDRKTGALKGLQGLIWKQGYDNGDIKGHVYDDVLPALEQWKSVEDRKVYIYSSGSVQAQKLLFGQSVAGDLLKYIDGHFDTKVGQKREAVSYTKIAENIGCKPEEILFLTDIVEEAEAATTAGLNRALVVRGTNSRSTLVLPALTSFAPLCPTLKRPHDQEMEEKPAKIAKTTEEESVKQADDEPAKQADDEPVKQSETEPACDAKQAETGSDAKDEAMSVDDDIKEVPSVTVEEVIDNSSDDLPVVTAEPIVEEEQVEKMDEDKTDENGSVKCDKENVTEIEEISDKEPAGEVVEGEVEEPKSVEMTELQNAGEVLDKECDEILSKMKNITDAPLTDKITIAKNGDTEVVEESKMEEDQETMEAGKEASDEDAEVKEEIAKTEDEGVKVNEEIVEEKAKIEETNVEVVKSKGKFDKEVETPKENNVAKEKEVASEKETEDIAIVDQKVGTEKEVIEISDNIEKAKEETTEKSKEETEVAIEKVKEVPEVKVDAEVKVEEKEQQKEKEVKTDKPKEDEDTKSADEPMEAIEEPQVNGKSNGENKSLNGKTNGDEVESRIGNGDKVENGKEAGNGVNNENEKGEEDGVAEMKAKAVPTEVVPGQATET